MDKLPRKEDLLPKQSQEPNIIKEAATSLVQQSKDEAEIAAQKDKQSESEIKMRMRAKGLESLEAGLVEVERLKREAQKMLESARQIENSAESMKEEYEQNKLKVVNAYSIVKKREESVDHKLQESLELKAEAARKLARCIAIKNELRGDILYHQNNIRPCLKSLSRVSRAIYTWIDVLNETEYDFSPLYNYIGKIMRAVDKYVDRES